MLYQAGIGLDDDDILGWNDHKTKKAAAAKGNVGGIFSPGLASEQVLPLEKLTSMESELDMGRLLDMHKVCWICHCC